MIKSRSFQLPFFVILFFAYITFIQVIGTVQLWQDAFIYFSYAVNLLQTGIYGSTSGVPDMAREPGYGFFLAIVLRILRFIGWIKNYAEAGKSPGIYGISVI
jgi:hypothetical protein